MGEFKINKIRIMKKIIFILAAVLVSCGHPVTPRQKQDSVLNYKGATVLTKEVGLSDCYILRIRTYNKNTKQYVIKTIEVYDGSNYRAGDIIK